jgi:phage head maturation protease
MSITGDCGCDIRHDPSIADGETRWDGPAAMSACASSGTPGSCYGAICAGRKAGDPALQSSWALPHHPRPGAPADPAGVRNALSRLPQTQGLTNAAAARRHLEAHLAQAQANAAHPVPDLDVVRSGEVIEFRDGASVDGSLGTLTGRFTEFGRWYPVRSMFEGDFMERVKRGATADTIRDDITGMRVLFDHGMDHQLGNKVLGPIEVLEEKSDGPHYQVPLFDTSYNRDLLPGLKANVYGASMRMRVTADEWDDEPGRADHNPDGLPERTITRMRVLEFGPVTFPANPGASAGVRSGTDEFYSRLAERDPAAFAGACRAAGIEDFTSRYTGRTGPAGGQGVQPGNGRTSPTAQLARTWALRIRGIR